LQHWWRCRTNTAPGLDRLPKNLAESRTAEKLQAIVDLDLDELLAIEPPRGYGRD